MITTNCFVDITRGKLVQLFVVPENDNCYIDRTEDGKLMSLLEKTAFALEKGSGAITYQYVVEGRGLVGCRACNGVGEALTRNGFCRL